MSYFEVCFTVTFKMKSLFLMLNYFHLYKIWSWKMLWKELVMSVRICNTLLKQSIMLEVCIIQLLSISQTMLCWSFFNNFPVFFLMFASRFQGSVCQIQQQVLLLLRPNVYVPGSVPGMLTKTLQSELYYYSHLIH